MAKKTNRKPGQVKTVTSQHTAAMMKRKDNNLNHKRFTKFVFLLMILAFIGVPVAGFIVKLFM